MNPRTLNRVQLDAPQTLYLLEQSQADPAPQSTNWVVVTAEVEVAEWGGQGKMEMEEVVHGKSLQTCS